MNIGENTMFKISYRMCYKLMKGSLEPGLQCENPVLEVKTERVNVLAPKTIGRKQMERTGLKLSVTEQ
ncbi:unnamed protein product [Cuscuta campestris]|uniref:Uncharacterized protein n=1 Tax=Cuscuta campestris TaxID=132261 RepID=A0A484KML4_9ASTE|nr:unnamed protein product [Cuscuta campestris]